ncbi:hypothetical protein Efla_000472 [Eimeria flavescens]
MRISLLISRVTPEARAAAAADSGLLPSSFESSGLSKRMQPWAVLTAVIAVAVATALVLHFCLRLAAAGKKETPTLGPNDPLSKWIASGATEKQIWRAKLRRHNEVQQMALKEAARIYSAMRRALRGETELLIEGDDDVFV